MKKMIITSTALLLFYCINAQQWSTSGNDIYNSNSGNVGIGTIAYEKLSVGGNILIQHNNDYLQLSDRLTLQATNTVANDWTRSLIGHNIRWNPNTEMWRVDAGPYADCSMIRFENGGAIGFYVRNYSGPSYEISNNDLNTYKRMSIDINGNVGIGTTTTGSYKLAVEGKIGAREIKVTLENPWADYVFNKNYQLRSLTSLEKYINQYKHLPGLPSSAEVNKNGGIELGEMNRKLVEKVEELTLYMIELNRKVEKLEKENETLKAKKYKNK